MGWLAGIPVSAGLNDLVEEGVTAVLDVAQIGGGLAPGQVAVKRCTQVQAQQAGAHESEVVDTQCAGIEHDGGFGAGRAAAAGGRHGGVEEGVHGGFPGENGG